MLFICNNCQKLRKKLIEYGPIKLKKNQLDSTHDEPKENHKGVVQQLDI
ncbi:unnamed protein product [Paramecium sonneborni]|uniref:Uncharacterized protein n=1 Tax=Paramecium sonneborni TaxID=65129 RepID=A0A8S1MMU3_9CILI|nr:unnamed protein product [Paramecium sonneborni]